MLDCVAIPCRVEMVSQRLARQMQRIRGSCFARMGEVAVSGPVVACTSCVRRVVLSYWYSERMRVS